MREKQTLTTLTTSIMINLEKIYLEEKPKVVLVHGDTTTTFCSSLGAFYQKIDIGHVEAGLRSNDLYFPFPEEANRKSLSVQTNFIIPSSIISSLSVSFLKTKTTLPK